MSSPTMLPPAPDLAPDAAILTPGDAPSHRGPAGRTAATPITIARGDGIGPEIMDATLRLLEAAGARLDIEEVEIGERVYRQGISSGVGAGTWSSLRRTGVFLKAPITTPQGGGFKSLNVTTRKTLGLYANVRPCASLHPFVPTKHPALDLVIIRENEEDTYAGIEHRQTREVGSASSCTRARDASASPGTPSSTPARTAGRR